MKIVVKKTNSVTDTEMRFALTSVRAPLGARGGESWLLPTRGKRCCSRRHRAASSAIISVLPLQPWTWGAINHTGSHHAVM